MIMIFCNTLVMMSILELVQHYVQVEYPCYPQFTLTSRYIQYSPWKLFCIKQLDAGN